MPRKPTRQKSGFLVPFHNCNCSNAHWANDYVNITVASFKWLVCYWLCVLFVNWSWTTAPWRRKTLTRRPCPLCTRTNKRSPPHLFFQFLRFVRIDQVDSWRLSWVTICSNRVSAFYGFHVRQFFIRTRDDVVIIPAISCWPALNHSWVKPPCRTTRINLR